MANWWQDRAGENKSDDVDDDFENAEQEIVDFVKELCHALGQIIPGFEATCNFLIESQLPGIIDGLVPSH